LENQKCGHIRREEGAGILIDILAAGTAMLNKIQRFVCLEIPIMDK